MGHEATCTSFGFGGGEVIVGAMSIEEARKLLQRNYRARTLFDLEDVRRPGDPFVVNPLQVKLLQEVEGR